MIEKQTHLVVVDDIGRFHLQLFRNSSFHENRVITDRITIYDDDGLPVHGVVIAKQTNDWDYDKKPGAKNRRSNLKQSRNFEKIIKFMRGE